MKILLINKFHYYKGGSETYYFGLADLLRSRGHEVIFFSMKDDRNIPCRQEKYFVENVDYNSPMSLIQMAKAGTSLLYSFEAKHKLEQLILDERPDVAHVNLFQSQLTGSIVDVLYRHHIPIIYSEHDLKAVCPTYLFMYRGEICRECLYGNYMPCIRKRCMKDSLPKSILAALEAEVYRHGKIYDKMDLIIVPSNHHKKYLKESGITRTKIVRIRNFLPKTVKTVEQVCSGKYFLYFGRLSPEKGVMTLLHAYRMSHVSSPLYIVGDGPMTEEAVSYIEKYGLTDQVKMPGYKRGRELTKIVENARCVVIPSECCENAPYAVLEAMAAGRPLIVTDNGGLPELVRSGENGFVVRSHDLQGLADCLDKVDKMPQEELTRMGEKSLKMVKETADADKYADRIIDIYRKAIRKKQRL